jgi:hypothetical protein
MRKYFKNRLDIEELNQKNDALDSQLAVVLAAKSRV